MPVTQTIPDTKRRNSAHLVLLLLAFPLGWGGLANLWSGPGQLLGRSGAGTILEPQHIHVTSTSQPYHINFSHVRSIWHPHHSHVTSTSQPCHIHITSTPQPHHIHMSPLCHNHVMSTSVWPFHILHCCCTVTVHLLPSWRIVFWISASCFALFHDKSIFKNLPF